MLQIKLKMAKNGYWWGKEVLLAEWKNCKYVDCSLRKVYSTRKKIYVFIFKCEKRIQLPVFNSEMCLKFTHVTLNITINKLVCCGHHKSFFYINEVH